MRHTGALLCLGAASVAYAASDSPRPRGVGPEFAKFYKDSNAFTCISNPSITLLPSQVNDDYCDCPDGSDEPGTAACAHLSTLSPSTPANVAAHDSVNATIALPGFYCKNKGHQPSYLHFGNVNDGVCDYELCCDGSDEWEGVGGVKCEDRCKEIGKEWRKMDEARQRSMGNAVKRRKELVTEAGRLRKEVEDRVQTLHTQIQGAEKHVADLERELEDVQRREKGKVVKGNVGEKAGKLGVLVGLARQRIDELKENLIRVKGERTSAKERMEELEAILSTFKEEYNPNFNDEGVKRAVRAWEDYVAKDKPTVGDAAHDRDIDEIVKSDEENGINWDEYTGQEEESDVDLLYDFEAYLPVPFRTWLDQKLRDLRIMLVENGILADLSTDSSGSEPKAVAEARNRLSAAQDELKNAQNGLNSHNEDLNKDYGPSDVFRALKDTCISTDSGEYTYELCFMGRTTQKPKKGGGHTNMGSYNRLETVHVDEDLPADGRGLGKGDRIAMKHEGGQHCWNGPNRSTTVVLACAEKEEIWKIVEEEKCVYRMEVGTPAVCGLDGHGSGNGGGDGEAKKNPRDEL